MTQRQRCRLMAERLGAQVTAEFIEPAMLSLARPLLREAVVTAFWERLDFLIVPSRAHLASNQDHAVEVAWRLGFAGTHIVAADRPAELAQWDLG